MLFRSDRLATFVKVDELNISAETLKHLSEFKYYFGWMIKMLIASDLSKSYWFETLLQSGEETDDRVVKSGFERVRYHNAFYNIKQRLAEGYVQDEYQDFFITCVLENVAILRDAYDRLKKGRAYTALIKNGDKNPHDILEVTDYKALQDEVNSEYHYEYLRRFCSNEDKVDLVRKTLCCFKI